MITKTNEKIKNWEVTEMENRKNEILTNLTALKNKYYGKQEGLTEILKLQKEMTSEMFSNESIVHRNFYDIINGISNFRFRDKRIKNEIAGSFISNCYKITNKLKSEKSGMQGERIANYSLDNIREEYVVLRNLELDDNGKKTEIDFVVITKYGVFILEIKNTTRNVIIDNVGNYFTISFRGEKHFDKNIGIKCNNRKALLEKAIKKAGFLEILVKKEIQQIVVFTNTEIKVQNDFKYIKECYLSTLPHIIDEFRGEQILSRRDMSNLLIQLQAQESQSEYLPINLDMEQFKNDFADILIIMEQEKRIYNNWNKKDTIITRMNQLGKKIYDVYIKKFVA